MYAAMLPLRGYLRRKYPPEYWEARFRKTQEETHGEG
jgi:hypothetical protein